MPGNDLMPAEAGTQYLAADRNLALVPGLAALRDLADGGAGITIAVIDGPVDLDHPVLTGADIRMADGATRWPARTGNRLAEHGTMVASILFGQPGSGVEGIAPRARGIVIPVYNLDSGKAPQLEVARAIEMALKEGADVINFSGGQYSDTGVAERWLDAAVARCAEAGVLLVAAAGNDGCECLHVPAAASTALAVGAVDEAGMPMDFSNYGTGYACNGITAPGEGILGAVPGGGLARMSGTSFATPIVSGVAALLAAVDPALRGGRIRDFLLATASPCGINSPEACKKLLVGRLDVEGAVAAMTTTTAVPSADSGEVTPSCGCGGTGHVTPQASAGVQPSMADAPDADGMVYALGNISYDFGTEARRDSFKQLMPPVEIDGNVVPPNPYDARQLVAYLGTHPYEGRALTWTLNIELTPIYALEPTGAFGANLYEMLTEMLAGEVLAENDEDHIQRVSIPGRLTGRTVRLFSGQHVPVLQLENPRGAYGWKTNALVEQASQAVSTSAKASVEADTVAANLRMFLDKVYYDLRNLGVLSSDRALNFAATNAFQAATVFSEALGSGMQLEDVHTEPSPFARADADAWDVKMKFFDPDNTRRARKIYRFTVDVSDLMPVTLGEVRSWTSAS
ncbi:MAG: PatA/PatG family cyanobactin maturation protease [Actinomycetales bacterium]|nr:PatA/PatG family cyanobactin maturation protease [Actinomycetales bacterium]